MSSVTRSNYNEGRCRLCSLAHTVMVVFFNLSNNGLLEIQFEIWWQEMFAVFRVQRKKK